MTDLGLFSEKLTLYKGALSAFVKSGGPDGYFEPVQLWQERWAFSLAIALNGEFSQLRVQVLYRAMLTELLLSTHDVWKEALQRQIKQGDEVLFKYRRAELKKKGKSSVVMSSADEFKRRLSDIVAEAQLLGKVAPTHLKPDDVDWHLIFSDEIAVSNKVAGLVEEMSDIMLALDKDWRDYFSFRLNWSRLALALIALAVAAGGLWWTVFHR